MGHPYKYPLKNIPLGCLWNYVNLRTFLGKFMEFIAKVNICENYVDLGQRNMEQKGKNLFF